MQKLLLDFCIFYLLKLPSVVILKSCLEKTLLTCSVGRYREAYLHFIYLFFAGVANPLIKAKILPTVLVLELAEATGSARNLLMGILGRRHKCCHLCVPRGSTLWLSRKRGKRGFPIFAVVWFLLKDAETPDRITGLHLRFCKNLLILVLILRNMKPP